MANQVYVLFTWHENDGQHSQKVVMNYSDYHLSDLKQPASEKGQEAARQYIINNLKGNPKKDSYIRVDYSGEVPVNQNAPQDTTNKSKKIKSSENSKSFSDDDDDESSDSDYFKILKILFFPFKLLWKIIVGLWKALMWFGRL